MWTNKNNIKYYGQSTNVITVVLDSAYSITLELFFFYYNVNYIILVQKVESTKYKHTYSS